MVIDQSVGEQTRQVATGFAFLQPDLLCRRLDGPSSSRARNVGTRLATGEVLAFLDDDCIVGPDWLHQVVDAFARHPHAGLVCGSLVKALNDATMFVAEFRIPAERELTGWRTARHAWGVGASVYVRREAAAHVGP